jgi:[ribosomal protein S18]-alanine N-acetyltransferase
MKDNTADIVIASCNNLEIFQQCAAMMASSDPWITMGINYAHCLLAFEGDWRETYVLWYQRQLAGFVIIQPLGTFKGYIQTICISEQHRGRGFGHQLLHFCEEKILETSPNIFICVSAFNTRALKLYEAFGFERIGELPNFVKSDFTEILLRKTVGPMMP